MWIIFLSGRISSLTNPVTAIDIHREVWYTAGMNKFRIIAGLIGAFFILTGCAETEPVTDEQGRKIEAIEVPYVTIKLSDGRFVDCIEERTHYGWKVHDCNWLTLREDYEG